MVVVIVVVVDVIVIVVIVDVILLLLLESVQVLRQQVFPDFGPPHCQHFQCKLEIMYVTSPSKTNNNPAQFSTYYFFGWGGHQPSPQGYPYQILLTKKSFRQLTTTQQNLNSIVASPIVNLNYFSQS